MATLQRRSAEHLVVDPDGEVERVPGGKRAGWKEVAPGAFGVVILHQIAIDGGIELVAQHTHRPFAGWPEEQFLDYRAPGGAESIDAKDQTAVEAGSGMNG